VSFSFSATFLESVFSRLALHALDRPCQTRIKIRAGSPGLLRMFSGAYILQMDSEEVCLEQLRQVKECTGAVEAYRMPRQDLIRVLTTECIEHAFLRWRWPVKILGIDPSPFTDAWLPGAHSVQSAEPAKAKSRTRAHWILCCKQMP